MVEERKGFWKDDVVGKGDEVGRQAGEEGTEREDAVERMKMRKRNGSRRRCGTDKEDKV